jgi:hypothetical protein
MDHEEQRETPPATTRDVLIISGAATLMMLALLFGSFGIAAVRTHIADVSSCQHHLPV